MTIKPYAFDFNYSCLHQGGIMDYADDVNYDKSQWSTCSVEAFTSLMNENKTCLQVNEAVAQVNTMLDRCTFLG